MLLNQWFCIMRFLFLLWYCLVKHFNNIIQFLLKISLIYEINLFVISSIFLLMEDVLLKTIVIVVGKLTRSRVLQGGVGWGFVRPQGAGMRQKNFPRHAGWVENGVKQNHMGWGRRPHHSDLPCPIAIPK